MDVPVASRRFRVPELRIDGAALGVLLALLAGCASGLSSEAKRQVTYSGPFAQLAASPSGMVGQVVRVGGRILEVGAGESRSEILVLQHPLDPSSDRPKREKGSEGRFLVESKTFLDPEVFRPSDLVSVVGKVVGSSRRQVGGYSMVLPHIEPIEVKVWTPVEGPGYPAVTFGIGVGTHF